MNQSRIRVAHYFPSYPSCNGVSSFCTGLSVAMNREEEGSCPIITCREGATAVEGEELLLYADKRRHPFSVPKALVDDLKNGSLELDGMVLHGTYNPPMAGLARILRKLGIPYIFIPHDPYVESLRKHHFFRKYFYWHLFEKPMIEAASAVQILDQEHERFLRALGCGVPTFVESNGCNPSSLALLPANSYSPGARERIQINYLGRMDRNHKGLDLLIKAFARLPVSLNVDLVLTGNDWVDRAELEQLAVRLGVQDRVNFRGRRPEPSIVIQAEADLCVLTSRFDGFGLTIVEGMLAGRPVLVSTEAGIAFHVEQSGGGWTVKPTVDAIEQGLVDAIEAKSLWKEYGERNHRYVLDNLTWEKVAINTRGHYRRIFCEK